MKKKPKIYCPYCGAEAKLRPASVVYKENTIDETAYLFVCDRYPKCVSYVNAHRDSIDHLQRALLWQQILRQHTHTWSYL